MKTNTEDIEQGFQQYENESESSEDIFISESTSSQESNQSRYHFSQDSQQREIEEQQDFDFLMTRDILMQQNANVKYSDEFSCFSSQGSKKDHFDIDSQEISEDNTKLNLKQNLQENYIDSTNLKKNEKNLGNLLQNYRQERKKKQESLKRPEFGQDKRIQIQKIRDTEYERRLAIRNPNEYKVDIGMSGTTCTLIIIIGDMIYYGYVGDSLACYLKKKNHFAEQNTKNHHHIITWPIHLPDEPNEKIRIYQKKGEMRDQPGHIQKARQRQSQKNNDDQLVQELFFTDMLDPRTRNRIYMRGRMYPGIGISRSLGDYYAHRIGVTSEPTVGSLRITRFMEYIVIATNSLWAVMTPKDVFEFIKQHNAQGIGMVSSLLAVKVKELYVMEKKDGHQPFVPDITIVIQALNTQVIKYK